MALEEVGLSFQCVLNFHIFSPCTIQNCYEKDFTSVLLVPCVFNGEKMSQSSSHVISSYCFFLSSLKELQMASCRNIKLPLCLGTPVSAGVPTDVIRRDHQGFLLSALWPDSADHSVHFLVFAIQSAFPRNESVPLLGSPDWPGDRRAVCTSSPWRSGGPSLLGHGSEIPSFTVLKIGRPRLNSPHTQALGPPVCLADIRVR